MPVRYSTASRNVFDGIVPVLVHTPPSIRSCSITATDLPSLAAAMAAFCPPGPEPMTTRSYSRMDRCMCLLLLVNDAALRTRLTPLFWDLPRSAGLSKIADRFQRADRGFPAGNYHRDS